MLDKTFEPSDVERRCYAQWEASGAFAADPDSNKAPYTIMMPPPNVTGSLHMGHALTFTLQDVLVRYQRMRGRDVLWQPGTDHAGIATEIVVAGQIAEEGGSKRDLGRERFVARVWEWKEQSGGTITRQLRRLGASPDWPRERFTMDPGLAAAVRRVFVAALPRGADLPRQAARQLGPGDAHGDLGSRGREPRDQRLALAHPLPDRGRAWPLYRGRDDAARDDARRHRGRGASGGCAIRRSGRQIRPPAARRPADPDHRRRVRRSRDRQRRGQDHAGARLQRFRGRPAARAG